MFPMTPTVGAVCALISSQRGLRAFSFHQAHGQVMLILLPGFAYCLSPVLYCKRHRRKDIFCFVPLPLTSFLKWCLAHGRHSINFCWIISNSFCPLWPVRWQVWIVWNLILYKTCKLSILWGGVSCTYLKVLFLFEGRGFPNSFTLIQI